MTPIKNESLVQRIINKITDSIIAGELKPGDKLPTEMELIAAFQVSRNTVREAIRTLIAYGVVEIRRPEYLRLRRLLQQDDKSPAVQNNTPKRGFL